MATLVRKIPDQLSGLGSATQGQYQLQDNAYDYAVAGIPFLSATNDQRPYTERMAEIRKQQFDSFAEPGEQSLQGWWLRSQSTFNGGAGVLYQDPDNDNQFNYRFADSLGISPWDPGELHLLRNSTHPGVSVVTNNRVQGYVTSAGVDAYWDMDASNLTKRTDVGNTAIITGAVNVLMDITSSGDRYFLATSTGVYTATDAGAPVQTYTTAMTRSVIEAVKDRLIVTNAADVHQIAYTGAPVALPAAVYTHPNVNWTWRSITDGPNAIYIAGDDGTTSQIHKFTATIVAAVPTLTWVGVTATMPAGEKINTIFSYVGSFVGIATNKGFRVGELDANGDIVYGPLLFEPAGGCAGIAGFDRFMWVGSTLAHEGASGLFRVDLGNQIQEQSTRAVRYAYARDLYFDGSVNAVSSVGNFGASDRIVWAVNLEGTYREMATELLPSGFLDTGRIRFNTEEPKLYKFFSIRTPSPLTGDVSVTVLTEGGGEIPTITYSPTVSAGVKDVGISQPNGPQNWLALRFTLARGSDTALGGVLNGWQIKALPGSIRQRMISQTFLLQDQEQDKTGQRIGYDGYARVRFEDFKAVARAGDVILFQELAEKLSTQVVIDDWQYMQASSPGPNQGALGGYLTVVMRTVAEST